MCPLVCMNAGCWYMGFGEQTQGKDYCWLWVDSLRWWSEEFHNQECLLRKGRLPQKQRTITERHTKGGAPTAASPHVLAPASLSTREGSHRSKPMLPPSPSLPRLPPPHLGGPLAPSCLSPLPPDQLAQPSSTIAPALLGGQLTLSIAAPSHLDGLMCSSSLQSRKLMGQLHAEVGLKPQLSPRGLVTKEELKSLCKAVWTMDYTSTDSFINLLPIEHPNRQVHSQKRKKVT